MRAGEAQASPAFFMADTLARWHKKAAPGEVPGAA
jgi:hypothetical protein